MAQAHPGGNHNLSVLCSQCGYHIPWHDEHDYSASCMRCGHQIQGVSNKSLNKTLAFSLTAMIFYIPAIVFPFMTMEVNGVQNSSTIWKGVVTLMEQGSYFVAIVVFLASLVIPAIKLLLLFYLSFSVRHHTGNRLKTFILRFVEQIGRWSMLDIFLLAVLVAIMKISPTTYVKPEIGAVAFAFVVIFTMLASASFDPRLLWSKNHEPE